MTSGTPDFSVTVCFGKDVFGFIAFRHETYLQYGPEGSWVHLPSWAFGLCFLALALFEWWFVQMLVRTAARLWKRRKRKSS